MTVIGTGYIGNTIQKLEDLLAASRAFQEGTGASDALVAKNFIFYPDHEGNQVDYSRPFAVIQLSEDGPREGVKNANKSFDTSGTHTLSLVKPTPSGLSLKDALIDMTNFIDGCLDEMLAIEGDSDNYVIESYNVDKVIYVKIEERDTRGSYMEADITIVTATTRGGG